MSRHFSYRLCKKRATFRSNSVCHFFISTTDIMSTNDCSIRFIFHSPTQRYVGSKHSCGEIRIILLPITHLSFRWCHILYKIPRIPICSLYLRYFNHFHSFIRKEQVRILCTFLPKKEQFVGSFFASLLSRSDK